MWNLCHQMKNLQILRKPKGFQRDSCISHKEFVQFSEKNISVLSLSCSVQFMLHKMAVKHWATIRNRLVPHKR